MNEEYESFDFVVNDEDEVMLLLYEREGAPYEAFLEVDKDDNSAVLQRNENDVILLEEIPEDIFDSLEEADTILVCELSREADEADTKIMQAYEAEVRF
ncbi:MAG: hypothetical protein PHE89_03565 [Alphaproteobacteria bacterium]|nr:hypothetical protein [Alphaproteobacteria bacterium]